MVDTGLSMPVAWRSWNLINWISESVGCIRSLAFWIVNGRPYPVSGSMGLSTWWGFWSNFTFMKVPSTTLEDTLPHIAIALPLRLLTLDNMYTDIAKQSRLGYFIRNNPYKQYDPLYLLVSSAQSGNVAISWYGHATLQSRKRVDIFLNSKDFHQLSIKCKSRSEKNIEKSKKVD